MRNPLPMLAQLDCRLPVGQHWRYEPKLDGFRGLLRRRGSGHVQLLSRNARDLGPWFPEIVAAAQNLPPGTLLDGEIVICDEAGWVDFGGLQARLSTARNRVRDVVRQRPAALIAFDLLEARGAPIQAEPLARRRSELERLMHGLHPCLQLVDQTADVQMAREWLSLPSVEGVVAKRADRPYIAGRVPDWIKVKRQRTVDCVVIGLAGDAGAPKLVLGLRHADGQLHHFAVTRPLGPEHARTVTGLLAEAGAMERAIRSRWQHDAIPPWRRVPPRLICEVRVSNLDAGRWARFPAVFMRWRLDRSPEECGLEQLVL
jgi:ATP-dependent DNA ligase